MQSSYQNFHPYVLLILEWNGTSEKYIKVVHFFSGRLPDFRSQINKDSNPLSMFLLFSQQFFKYKWTVQSNAITHDEGPYPLSEMTVPDMCLFVERK
jgi:hypothetical protein